MNTVRLVHFSEQTATVKVKPRINPMSHKKHSVDCRSQKPLTNQEVATEG